MGTMDGKDVRTIYSERGYDISTPNLSKDGENILTTYLDYDVLKDAITAGWNISNIALPGFEDGDLSFQNDKNTLNIQILPSKAEFITTGTGTKDNIITEFILQLHTENKTNSDLYLTEVRSILNAKITNGYRHIDRWVQDKTSDFFTWIVYGNEVLRDFA